MKLSVKIVIAAAIVVLAAVSYGYYSYAHTVDIGDRVVTVVIKAGDTLNIIAKKLLSEGVIDSRFMLVYPARLMSLDKRLPPGRYDFTGKNSCSPRSVSMKAGPLRRNSN